MKRISNLLNSFLPVLPYLIVFIYSFYQPSDPDLGWHLKYGEYFWQHGQLLRGNAFSTMMPYYHWANSSWLTDIISYTAYHLGGLFGITLLGASVVMLTFLFFAKAFSLTRWQQILIFPLIIYLEAPVNAVSFRGQQLALLCVGILFYLFSQYEKRPKILWFAIPLFIVWAGFDGEFILGYVLFGLWVVLYFVKKHWQKIFARDSLKERNKKSITNYFEKTKNLLFKERKEMLFLFAILIFSLLATFINPFGYGIHLDALRHIGNPLLKDISEYLPFVYLSQQWWNELAVGVILTFGLFILFFRGKFFELLPTLGGGLVLYILSLQVRRYAWPAYYLVFPLLAMSATFLKPVSKKTTKMASWIILVLLLFIIVWKQYPFTQYSTFTWNDYCRLQTDPCTQQSAQYLITHHLTHNIYTLYSWGGWLIWNYPQIKPSIDGRMHMWVENSYSAFTDYYSVEQNYRDIDKTKFSVAYMSPTKPVYTRLVLLTKEGKWKEVYKDRFSGIFVRKD